MSQRVETATDTAIAGEAALAKAIDLTIMALCLLPVFYLPFSGVFPELSRIYTMHMVEDNKWTVVTFLSFLSVALIAVWWAAQSQKTGLPPSLLRWGLLGSAMAYAAAHLASAALSREFGVSFRACLPNLGLIALLCAIIIWKPAARQVRKFMILITLSGTSVALLAVLQHAGIDLLAGLVRYAEADRYRTGVYVTLGNPEYLGGYLAPVVLIAVGILLTAKTWWGRGLSIAAIHFLVWQTVATYSRGALLGLCLATLLFLGGMVLLPSLQNPIPRARRRVYIIGAVSVIGLILMFRMNLKPVSTIRERFVTALNPYDDSIRNRIVFNLVGTRMAATHPLLGMGPGMYGPVFYPTFLDLQSSPPSPALEALAREFNGKVAEHSHNDWLEIWVETGLIGLAAWVLLLAVWGASLGRCFFDRTTVRRDAVLAWALAAAVFAILFNALFNFPLREPVRAALFCTLLALSSSLALRTSPNARED